MLGHIRVSHRLLHMQRHHAWQQLAAGGCCWLWGQLPRRLTLIALMVYTLKMVADFHFNNP
jgi:hypothetical protein